MNNKYLTIQKLFQLKNRVFEEAGENRSMDVGKLAKELEIDMEQVMAEIMEIAKSENYRVGAHMNCTRWNVIPDYLETGDVVVDRDHAEGLAQILAVHYGIREDY